MLVSKISGSTGDIVGFTLINGDRIIGILSGKGSTISIFNPMRLCMDYAMGYTMIPYQCFSTECEFRIENLITLPTKVTQEIAKLFLDTVSPKEV